MKERSGERLRFKGTFERYGIKRAYKGLPKETILLKDIKNTHGEEITEHLWFNYTKSFQGLGLLFPGDIILFDARVGSYEKGYVGRGEDNRTVDYHLTRPTRIEFFKMVERVAGYYDICPECGYHNLFEHENDCYCRRCGKPLGATKKLNPTRVVQQSPKMSQRTLESEFRGIMSSIGVKNE